MPTLQVAKALWQKDGRDGVSLAHEDDPRWQAVLRITRSDTFAKATRLCQFLMYVCERSLTNRLEEITEQQIGVHVFGKPATYNPSDDTIVRATARQLRQRLAVYYQEVGIRDSLKITIPRGGYIPIFVSEETEPLRTSILTEPSEEVHFIAEPETAPAPSSAHSKPQKQSKHIFAWGVVAGFAFAACAYLLFYTLTTRPTASEALWKQLFTRKRQTLIVAGDAGLNIFENLSRHEVDLDEYSSHSYLKSPEAQTPTGYTWDPLATRTYTTVQNLRLASQLIALPEARSTSMRIRFARELSMEDLKESNAILLGSPQYDPWEHLLEKDLNFTVHYDGVANTITIYNRAPQQGEQGSYTWTPSNPSHIGYALITLTNNLSGSGKILLVQGTTAAGDDAAGDFLLNEQRIGSVLKFAEDRFGRLHNFQLLIETTMTGGDSHASRVIAEKILKN
jgi:hypothetical protein